MTRLMPDTTEGCRRTIRCDDPRIDQVEVVVGVDGVATLDDNVDVAITTAKGQVFNFVFLTPTNTATLLARWRRSGECGGGAFLTLADSVVVPSLTEEAIRAAVVAMADEGELEPGRLQPPTATDGTALTPREGSRLAIWANGDTRLGHMVVEEVRADLLLGSFEPVPEFSRYESLFAELEETVANQVFSLVDEVEDKIESLRPTVGWTRRGPRFPAHELQIWSTGRISLRLTNKEAD